MQSALLTQNLHELLNDDGFDEAFTGPHLKSSTTSRSVSVAETVDSNDIARSAAGVPA